MISIAFLDIIGLPYDGDTLKKRGLGGSESATILMAKELTKLGFSVTIFNNCNKDSNLAREGTKMNSQQQRLWKSIDLSILSQLSTSFK